jgi:hypothetical protein
VEATGVEFNAMKIADNTEITNANRAGVEPLNEAVEEIKPCWTKPSPSNNIYYIILQEVFLYIHIYHRLFWLLILFILQRMICLTVLLHCR